MRKAAVLLISTAAVMLIVGGVISQSLVILQRVAAVDEARGEIWVRPRGQENFIPLGDRPRVAAGDTLKTANDAHVDLHWVDGTRMRVGPGALMTVLKNQMNSATRAESAMFKLDLGRVWIRVLKVLSQKSKFEVITPTATAGVRGTVFSVAVTPEGQTLVSVHEGHVSVAAGGAAREVGEGQMLAGETPAQLSADEAGLWDTNVSIAGPHLEIKAPAVGTKVAPGGDVEIIGTAEPDAAVTINGQPVTLRLEKVIKTAVMAPAQPGPFTIIVTAKDRRGFETSREITVEVDAQVPVDTR